MPDTVAIHHPRDPTRPTLIRADRYDPARHRIWGAPEADGFQGPQEDAHEDAAPEPEEERPDEEDGPLPDDAVTDEVDEPDADA